MLSKALKLQETSSFIVEWIKSPLVTASVIPSSTRLAKKMVQGLSPDSEQVIELGPGTGVFTNQLLAAGIKEEALVLVELNNKFAGKLRKKYPQATVINGAAEALPRLQLKKANAVVSGLPLLSMRDKQISTKCNRLMSQLYDEWNPDEAGNLQATRELALASGLPNKRRKRNSVVAGDGVCERGGWRIPTIVFIL